MKFHLMNETAFDNSYRFALCMEGSSTAKLKLDSSYDSYDIGTLHCYNYVYSDYVTDWGGFSITDATEGDYITISSHYYTLTGDEINLGRAALGFATINGPRVTGIITGQTTEECFPITKPEFDNGSFWKMKMEISLNQLILKSLMVNYLLFIEMKINLDIYVSSVQMMKLLLKDKYYFLSK